MRLRFAASRRRYALFCQNKYLRLMRRLHGQPEEIRLVLSGGGKEVD